MEVAMSEPPTRRTAKLIRGPREVRAIVEDATQSPWSIVEEETSRPVSWEVMIVLVGDPNPLVFETRDEAKAWSDQSAKAPRLNWNFVRPAARPPHELAADN